MTTGHFLVITAFVTHPSVTSRESGLRLSGRPYRMHRSQQWVRCDYHFGIIR